MKECLDLRAAGKLRPGDTELRGPGKKGARDRQPLVSACLWCVENPKVAISPPPGLSLASLICLANPSLSLV